VAPRQIKVAASAPGSASLLQQAPRSGKQYNVLITGSTKGVGRALAQKFLEAGDSVCVSSRSADRVKETLSALSSVASSNGGTVRGIAADVAKPSDVAKLAQFAQTNLGPIDIWINNAGSNGYKYTPLAESDVNDLVSIVSTNTLGTMLCCREAIRVMRDQPSGGHIFNMDGAGADGNPTPRFAAYGSTKRGMAQFTKSLAAEIKQQNISNVVVHDLSPGMVTTELLMSGSTSSKVAKFFINCLAEEPDDVADFLVPRIRKVPQQNGPQYIRALTKPNAYGRIISRVLTGNRKNRFVKED